MKCCVPKARYNIMDLNIVACLQHAPDGSFHTPHDKRAYSACRMGLIGLRAFSTLFQTLMTNNSHQI